MMLRRQFAQRFRNCVGISLNRFQWSFAIDIHRSGPATERLDHRAFMPEDAEALFALNGNPEVMRWTGEPLLPSLEAARRAIESHRDFEDYGFGRWACVLKESGTVIGFCGLKYLPDLDEVDLGYRLLPQYWGRGLATEASLACLDFGFKQLNLAEIIALVLPQNVASVRVLEKVGMQADGEMMYDEMRVLRYHKHPK